MSGFRVQAGARHRLDEICTYGAERYIRGLFARFEAIAERRFS